MHGIPGSHIPFVLAFLLSNDELTIRKATQGALNGASAPKRKLVTPLIQRFPNPSPLLAVLVHLNIFAELYPVVKLLEQNGLVQADPLS